MLKTIIFDCDGVIANTEPLHLAAFQKVLGEEGIVLLNEDYYRHYLALDDRACFQTAFAHHGIPLTQGKLAQLVQRKKAYFEPVLRRHLQLFPGVVDFIREAAAKYPLAIASGALRHEVELIVQYGGVRDCFQVIVTAEDFLNSKPHPEPFLKALRLLNEKREDKIQPHECLVIEDSFHGVQAAHRAGMRCVAVTNSYPPEQLSAAEMVVESLAGLPLKEVESLFNPPATP
ncbi:MAG: HAD family phosphatase [Abditibacteriales bacterium]|nr:HAD family phosphatase [Abditibacteriales bacterium]MDW8365352.1 HAD family phosphatase [Abditibacteriales bacterium]